jgi:alpha-L-fucosidase
VEAESGGDWIEIARGSAIGHKKIDSLAVPIRATHIRLTVLESVGEPHIRSFSVYK